jgi:regulator of sigma E protease
MQQLLWFLVTLGILIPVHEYGHYRVAVACNVKVLRFSIGFGRVLWRHTFGPDRTEFVISMLPLGGYVRMLDEREVAVDGAELPRAFNRRPLWQRAAVVAAGPIANLLLAVALYGFVQWYGHEEPAPVASTPLAGSLMADAGLRSGDRIVAVAQGAPDADDAWQRVQSMDDVIEAVDHAMMSREPLFMRVTPVGGSGTRTLRVAVDTLDAAAEGLSAYRRLGLGAPFQAPRIAEVLPGSAAAGAGVQRGDLVVTVDGRPVPDAQALRDMILATAQDGDAPRAMQWEVRRDGRLTALAVTPRIVAEGRDRIARVGVGFEPFDRVFVQAGPLEAVRLGAVQTWRQAVGSVRIFGRMLVGDASLRNLSGPGTIAEVASSTAHQGLVPFLTFLAMVSVGLGVLNLLPIPMLDGGTLLYYLFEGATGRPVSELWQVWLQRGGALILLLLMSIALSNDVARHLGLQ